MLDVLDCLSGWPDDGIKSYLLFLKNCPKSCHPHFHNSYIIRNSPKSHQNILATLWENLLPRTCKIAQSGHIAAYLHCQFNSLTTKMSPLNLNTKVTQCTMIRTHDLLIGSLLPYPIDQGSRPKLMHFLQWDILLCHGAL